MTDRELREIQLSAKQVVFLVMSAVVVAVVIFLLGVAVGRDLRGTDLPMSADAGTETVVTDDPATPPTTELGYHDLLAGGAGAPPSSSTPPPAAVPDPVPAPVTETTPPPPAAPAPQPAASEVTGDWFLQVGAFSGRPAAENLAANLKKLKVSAFVLVPAAGGTDRFFRVRVGPYATQAEAEAVRRTLVREGHRPEIKRAG
jgi:septal ring-binding cell division protein DamX